VPRVGLEVRLPGEVRRTDRRGGLVQHGLTLAVGNGQRVIEVEDDGRESHGMLLERRPLDSYGCERI
jgi:hypothetical protein